MHVKTVHVSLTREGQKLVGSISYNVKQKMNGNTPSADILEIWILNERLLSSFMSYQNAANHSACKQTYFRSSPFVYLHIDTCNCEKTLVIWIIM